MDGDMWHGSGASVCYTYAPINSKCDPPPLPMGDLTFIKSNAPRLGVNNW